MTLNKEEQEYVKEAVTRGVKTAEMAYIIMIHRTRTANYNHRTYAIGTVQSEFTNIKIEINKILAKL